MRCVTTGPDTPEQPPIPRGPQSQPPMRPEDEKLWAIAAHLGPAVLGFIAPLVVWLVYRDRSPWLDRQAKEALNFQLTLLIAWVVAFVLVFVLIGFLLMAVIWVGSLVLMIIATVKVAALEDYRYPVNIRFIT